MFSLKLRLTYKMKIISYDGSMQEKSSMSYLCKDMIKTEIIDHGKRTRPSWDIFFEKLNLARKDLLNVDLFLICIGPGSSYTAVRSSVSFFKALCTGLSKPLAGISHDELRDLMQKNKEDTNSVNMIKLAQLNFKDYIESMPSSVNPIHDENNFKQINV